MRTIAILGSGFGLYGYLPALVSGCGLQVVLPERYRSRFAQRVELRPLASSVAWAQDERSALRIAWGAVLALPPSMQCKWLATCLEQPQLQYLFLEKPLAPNPDVARELYQKVERSGKVTRIAYLFRLLDWAQQVRKFCSQPVDGRLSICWRFMAHHFCHFKATWKRQHDEGGGPIRFYGIHMIALLAELGYTSVLKSVSSRGAAAYASRWRAVFTGPGKPDCEVLIDTASQDSQFSIVAHSHTIDSVLVRRASPFSHDHRPHMPGEFDGRIEMLTQHCQSAWNDHRCVQDFYRLTLELWSSVEAADQPENLRTVA